jgi:hypothetical protein
MSSLKGKSTCYKSSPVQEDLIEIPEGLFANNCKIDLCINILYVNKCRFRTTVDRNLIPKCNPNQELLTQRIPQCIGHGTASIQQHRISYQDYPVQWRVLRNDGKSEGQLRYPYEFDKRSGSCTRSRKE